MRKILAITALSVAVFWAAPATAQDVVTVSGDIEESTTWTADNVYLLSGAVFVREPAVLTIQAGTQIVGEQATNGTLIIDRGAQIIAAGTEKNPIVFTSDQPVGQRARADWGGLIINGFAPLNVPGGEAEGEGDTGTYGGDRPDDNSGVLRYVRVEFAGTEFSPDNELNGIAFQGVGDDTFVDFVQVHFNKDDGVEFFGGTVNAKHLVLTGIADDSLDATDGWTGSVQFVVIHQQGDDADNGFEIDNNGENNNLSPRTNPTIYNVTAVGDPDNGDESDIGMLLREGTAGLWANVVVTGFKEWGIVIDGQASLSEARNGDLAVQSGYFFNNGSGLARGAADKNFFTHENEENPPTFTTADFMKGNGPDSANFKNNVEGRAGDAKLRIKFAEVYTPRNNSSLLAKNGAQVADPPRRNPFIEKTDYIGAMDRGGINNWVRGWTETALS